MTKRKTTQLTFLSLFLLLLMGGATTIRAQEKTPKTIVQEKFYNQLNWRNIGPNRGGRSLGCMGSPGRPNEYYFGATGGGLWKTTDAGQEWFPVTDGQVTSSSVGAVGVAETNPDIVYIGMGETQLRGSITQGDGVYKTVDGGKNWRHLGLEETQAISRVRVHPTNPNITRDGGKNWRDITPDNLPKFSRVSIIEESLHDAGTLYVAANRYQVDDREPYVYRTTDYGKTWTKIITGIKKGHFARAVREDPVRKGMLFLATEHGVYVSFNSGDLWQSLQLNLPDTPVRDLVVKDNDVVLGTHGRGFWILDEIGPLRQLTPTLAEQDKILFQPTDAIRGLSQLVVPYYLQEQVDSVVIEILDGAGKVVDTFVGKEPEYKPDPNIPCLLYTSDAADE